MTITFRAQTSLGFATDTAAPFANHTWTLPTGHTTDDLLLACAGWKPYDTTISTPTGYASEIGPITSGTTAMGAGTGSVAAQVFTKTHTGAESDPSSTPSAQYSPWMNPMLALTKTVTGAWTVDSTSGTSETTTLNVNGAGSLAWAAGDMAVVVVVHRDDDASHTSPVLSASGVTFANLTQRLNNPTTTNGNDGAVYVYTADVTVGATATPNFTATVAASEGWVSIIFLRIAEPTVTTHNGAASVSVAVTASAAGVRTRFGAASVSVAVTATATGRPTHFGAASVPVVVTATATGTPTHFGAASVPVVVTATAAGVRTRFGVASVAVAVTATATGARTKFGAASVAVALTAAAAGTATKQGVASVSIAVTAAATGTPTHFGSASVGVVLTSAATGTPTHFGAASVAVAVTTSTAGVRTTFGAASGTVAVTASASGTPTHFGAASVAVVVTATATGSIPGVLVYDASYLTLTGREQTAVLTGRSQTAVLTGRHAHH